MHVFENVTIWTLLLDIGLCCSEMKLAESKPGKEEILCASI